MTSQVSRRSNARAHATAIGSALVLGALGFLTLGLTPVPNSMRAFVFQKFVDPLPTLPRIVIPKTPGAVDLTVRLQQFKTKLHRDLPETLQWGYEGTSPGPTIEVESGQLLRVHWKSELPLTHVLKAPKGMDMGDGSEPLPDVRNVTHLHGAVVSQPSITDRLHNNDGWPDAWIVQGQEQIAEYPNPQQARTLWYHDHAIGETGRNVAAGLAGLYVIHDDYERSLNLPSGKYEIPLAIQARGLNSDGTIYYTETLENEFYGNLAEVNGKIFPYLNVEPRKYRFRFVNASNARSYAMKLIDAANQNAVGPAFYQIGSDSGFLENTAVLNDPNNPASPRLTIAPAERADVIIDFSGYAGRNFYLHNTSRDGRDGELAIPQLMLFKVGTTLSEPDTSTLPMKMRAIPKLDPSQASVRQIVLNQMTMADGTVMQMLNNSSWRDPITEKVIQGSAETWEIVNTTPDIHPFHVHLVQFQILDRTPFDVDAFARTGKVSYTGPAVPPDPNEAGWKDVVRSSPGMVTRIIMRFEPYSGYYVYHCHILEHEDMDMMRPFQVLAN